MDLHGLTHSFPTRRSSDLSRSLSPDPLVEHRSASCARRMTGGRDGSPPTPPENRMLCPTCDNVHLAMTDRQGIEIDYCPQCRGIWLDRGELDRLIERAEQAAPRSEEHTTELPSLMRISHAAFCLQK